MKHVVAFLLCTFTALSPGAVFLNWERQYRVAPNQEAFRETAIDPMGNVYAIGTANNGSNLDVICVKYGFGGSLHWARRIAGAGDQVGKFVALTGDGTGVFIAYDRGLSCSVARLNASTGATSWVQNFEPDASNNQYHAEGLYVDRKTAPYPLVYVPLEAKYNSFTATALAGYAITDYGALYSGVFTAIGDAAQSVLDFAGRPTGGIYYLTGQKNPGPLNGQVHYFEPGGTYVGAVSTPTAQAIAYSDVGGGYAFAAGKDSATQVRLWRIRSATNSIAYTTTNDLAPLGADDLTVNDMAADSAGNVYPVGWFNVVDLNHQWLLARYNYPNFVRQWLASVLPTSIVDDEFHRVALDPSGNMVVSRSDFHPALPTGDIGAHVYESGTGTLLGSFLKTGVDSESRLLGVAANVNGQYSAAGYLTAAGAKYGLLWLLTQDGLKSCGTAAPAYVAGSVVLVQVRMYGSTGANRTVSLGSSSSFLPVPGSVTVLAGATGANVNCPSLRSAVDRNVVLTATFGGVVRQGTVNLKAPRPVALVFTPNPITGGTSGTGKVTMNGLAPTGGLRVLLGSSSSVAVVDAAVVVPAGAGAATFPVSTLAVTSSTPVTMSATYLDTTKTATLVVDP